MEETTHFRDQFLTLSREQKRLVHENQTLHEECYIFLVKEMRSKEESYTLSKRLVQFNEECEYLKSKLLDLEHKIIGGKKRDY